MLIPDDAQRNGVPNQYAVNKRKSVADMSIPPTTVTHTNTDEENIYQDGIANFTKGLQHNNLGRVDPNHLDQFLNAVQQSLADLPDYRNSLTFFENVPFSNVNPIRKWASPVAGLSYDSEGIDSFNRTILPHPTLNSPNAAAEMAELYWMALMRDINFTDYDNRAIAQDAVDDLQNNFSSYNFIKGWTRDPSTIPLSVKTLFRGTNIGDEVGPYISQFMYRGNRDELINRSERSGYVKYGTASIDQRIVPAKKGLDFMTDETGWLDVQNGLNTFERGERLITKGKKYFDDKRRFIRNLRDLATFVHFDQLYQAYLTACIYMLTEREISIAEGAMPPNIKFDLDDLNPYNPNNPYRQLMKQDPYINFGPPHILPLLTEVTSRALKAVWLQKWFVHRRLRPEAFGGLIHFKKTLPGQTTDYNIDNSILQNSNVLQKVFNRNGTYFLPQAFKEGSPMHPSYGAGHATVAGACVTVLKAWFKDGPMPNKILESEDDGEGLKNYTGNDVDQIYIHGELNKLAANIAIGRNGAGVHYRSDYTASLILGEEVAISILKELRSYLPEPPSNSNQYIFRFNRFFTNTLMQI